MSTSKLKPSPWEVSETAPSMLRSDDPTLARLVGGLGGACLVILGGIPLVLAGSGNPTRFGPGLSLVLLTAGMLGLLLHAAVDRDLEFRRIYMAFGYLVFALGAFLALVPYPHRVGDQFVKGFACMALALLFLLAFLRHEDDDWYRNLGVNFLGLAGAALGLTGLIGGSIRTDFLMPYGLLLALVGLVYAAAFVSNRGLADEWGYRAGLLIGLAGAVTFLVAFCRSAFPPLFYSAGWIRTAPAEYTAPAGIVLMFVGALYGLVSLGLCSDQPAVVVARRELGTYFCSPIAYITLAACTVAAWLAYALFMSDVLDRREPMFEPIVRNFILQWPTVLFTICIVPVITMRLLSEEKRSGTLEVLLTAPVGETSVVLGKFVAAWLFFLLSWVPFGLFLVALRVEGGKEFDYRPLLSFFFGLCFTGAGFIALGLFFSALTRNQIISGILSLVGMMALTLVFLLNMMLQRTKGPDTPWATVLTHVSYIDIWLDTSDGKLAPRLLLFYLSVAVASLFATVKVLEARRWA